MKTKYTGVVSATHYPMTIGRRGHEYTLNYKATGFRPNGPVEVKLNVPPDSDSILSFSKVGSEQFTALARGTQRISPSPRQTSTQRSKLSTTLLCIILP